MSTVDHAPALPHSAADMASRAAAENFPVASWFIAPELRPAVQLYYAFARAADDVADSPSLSVDQKLQLLDRLESGLAGGAEPIGRRLGEVLSTRRIDASCATDLLVAFRADARNEGIETLADLDDYCRHSAVPVGRFLLAVHGEPSDNPASDALAAALQILNHVQDLRDDVETLGRCYVPRRWLAAAGLTTDTLARDVIGRRNVTALLVRHAERHLSLGATLPARVADRRLAAQSAAIVALAQKLSERLRDADPWPTRITLRRRDWIGALGQGVMRFVAGPGHARV